MSEKKGYRRGRGVENSLSHHEGGHHQHHDGKPKYKHKKHGHKHNYSDHKKKHSGKKDPKKVAKFMKKGLYIGTNKAFKYFTRNKEGDIADPVE